MASKKVTELTTLTIPAGVDLLLVIDDPNGSPVSKKISINQLFGNIPANTSITAKLTVSGNTTLGGANTHITSNVNIAGAQLTAKKIVSTSNGVVITNSFTPANSSVGIPTIPVGKIFWDSGFLYVKVANTTIKRIALSSF